MYPQSFGYPKLKETETPTIQRTRNRRRRPFNQNNKNKKNKKNKRK